jgi:hypothetical protein
MDTKHDYRAAATRYMCMRAEGLLSHLTEAAYIDNLRMIGITWHGPQDPAAELETIRICEHPECKWQWGPFVDGIRGFERGHGILDDGTGQPDVRMVCYALTPVECPSCQARDALHRRCRRCTRVISEPGLCTECATMVQVKLVAMPISFEWTAADVEAAQRVGRDFAAERIEAARKEIERREAAMRRHDGS